MVQSNDSQYAAAGTNPPWPCGVEKWAELVDFEVDDSAFSVARRFSDGGRRNAPVLRYSGGRPD